MEQKIEDVMRRERTSFKFSALFLRSSRRGCTNYARHSTYEFLPRSGRSRQALEICLHESFKSLSIAVVHWGLRFIENSRKSR